MSGIATIGSQISCGSFIAAGSANVRVNFKPVAIMAQPATTGHGCWPPSVIMSGGSTSVFVNGSPVILEGAEMAPHKCGRNKHGGTVVGVSGDCSA